MADRTGSRLTAALATALVLAVVAAVAFSAGRVRSTFGLFDPGRGEYVETGATVLESMRELSVLTSVEAVQYTTVEKGNDRGWLNWATGDRIFLFAVARIGAGVDLQKLSPNDVEVDFESRRVVVTVPPAEITYVSLDSEATTVFDRDTGVFTRGDPQLESDARAVAETILRDQAVANGLLRDAELATRKALREFLRSVGFVDVRIEQG